MCLSMLLGFSKNRLMALLVFTVCLCPITPICALHYFFSSTCLSIICYSPSILQHTVIWHRIILLHWKWWRWWFSCFPIRWTLTWTHVILALQSICVIPARDILSGFHAITLSYFLSYWSFLFYLFFILFIYLFIGLSSFKNFFFFFNLFLFLAVLTLHCCAGFSLAAVQGLQRAQASALEAHGFSSCRFLLQSTGTVVHRLSCSETRGISLDQGSNLCLLHWQADSFFFFLVVKWSFIFLFPLQFLTSWALHCTTVDTVYDVMRVAAINIAAHRLGGPQDLFNGSRKFSS